MPATSIVFYPDYLLFFITNSILFNKIKVNKMISGFRETKKSFYFCSHNPDLILISAKVLMLIFHIENKQRNDIIVSIKQMLKV